MLCAIELRDFAIADAITVPLRPGLNVVTGETGAGKSLVIDALALASGGRADAGVVRDGAEAALVQLIFAPPAKVASAARRVVPEGRNVVRLDGEIVTVAELQAKLDATLGIFGQHAFRTLLDGQQQRLALDRTLGGDGRAALAAYRAAHARLLELERELRARAAEAAEQERRLELFRHAQAELEGAELRAGESDELDARLATLRQSERVRGGVARAIDALQERDEAASPALAEAQRALLAAAQHARPLQALAAELEGALDAVNAVASELEAFLEELGADPHELDRAEARRSQLDSLFRKHGGDEVAALAAREQSAAEVARLERLGNDLIGLERDRAQQDTARCEAGAVLTRARSEAATALQAAVGALLRELGLPRSAFRVALAPLPAPGAHGLERVEFRFTANAGEGEAPLTALASGGELSRVMLALNAVAGSDRDVLAFDEVDAGLGGRAGRSVGMLLQRLAEGRQVLVVTHLPQVAAFADHHLLVDKVEQGGRTLARITVLEGEARVRELARMLSGDDGQAALQHARELLAPRPEEARTRRSSLPGTP